MKWRGETQDEYRRRKGEYHKWFAWRPVQDAEGYWHWLEWVERRAWNADIADEMFFYDYRSLNSQ